MLVISDNINYLHHHVARAIEQRDEASIRELAHKVVELGADVIDANIGPLSRGGEEIMPWLVEQIQAVTDVQLSLDGHTADAIIAGAEVARRKPILNAYYVQVAHPEDVTGTLLPYAAANGLEIILPLVDNGSPSPDPDFRASVGDDLVKKAVAAGVPESAIFLDPVVVHLSGGEGQAHAYALLETMKRLDFMFDPPIRTLAGVEYISQGSPPELRSPLNRAYLAMMAAHKLDAAIVDVTDREMMRDIRLIKALRNESLYSESDAKL